LSRILRSASLGRRSLEWANRSSAERPHAPPAAAGIPPAHAWRGPAADTGAAPGPRPRTASSLASARSAVDQGFDGNSLGNSLILKTAFPAFSVGFPARGFRFPVPGLKFPVSGHREIARKGTGFQGVTATESAPPGPKKTKFPCSSL
jgi:hypothetical protein